MKIIRAAMIGDIVGEPGLKALEEQLPKIIIDNAVDFTVANGENTADGFGMTETALKRILACGVDVVTSGNHVWEKREFWQTLETDDQVLRPANYSSDTPGRGWLSVEKAGTNWVVINMQGREFMTPIDCPFRCFDSIIGGLGISASQTHDLLDGIGNIILPDVYPVIIVDFHAESSREKEAFGYYLDGRASVIAGTHTHVPTADEHILPQGTAYVTDLGMTGITNSIIGMDVAICLDRMRKQVLYRMEPAADRPDGSDAEVHGIIAEINAETGKALSIKRI